MGTISNKKGRLECISYILTCEGSNSQTIDLHIINEILLT